ncbi:MAG TPA: ATP-binding cassette domain-containing protein [Mycobacteriales bacterium]|nr:ATP-binding cassette domain-containing protein [Mycobacteriales bacterium]
MSGLFSPTGWLRPQVPTLDRRRGGLLLAAVGVLVLLAVFRSVADVETPIPVIALGTIIGLTYGLLSVGLVLIYRSNRIINFAHGETGAFGAAFFGLLASKYGVPYYLALPVGLLSGAGVAALAEVAVVRRLRNAPRLMSVVATLGVGQFLVVFSLVVNSQAGAGSKYPEPPGLPVYELGALRITQAYSGMLFFAPLVVIGLILFLTRSRFGLGIRSAAANPEAARMAGIPAARMSALSWALAGGLSAFTAILTAPTRGFSSGETFGPGLLLRALAGAVLARMNNLGLALAAGVGLGITEQILLWNKPQSGLVELALFLIILATLLLQKQRGGRDEEKGSWAAVIAARPVPDALREVWAVRNLGRLMGVAGLVVLIALPFRISNSNAVTIVSMMGFAIIGLSVGLVTGLGGQLSLGQFAIAAVGAWASYEVSSRTGNFALSLLYAGLAAAVASLVIGLPALRIRGLLLTVTTLGFALVTPAWLLQQEYVLGDGVDPGRPCLDRACENALDTGKRYYWFALAVTVVAVLLVRNLRSGGFGRLLVAVRDNEDNARAFTVRAAAVKTQGFLLAGFVAGLGGAVYGHALSRIGTSTFPTGASIDVVVMTVLGGISILAGPIIGVLWVIGLPAFVDLGSAGLAATRLGSLMLILYAPGGLAQILTPVRDRVVKLLARRAGVDVEAAYAAATAPVQTSIGATGAARRTSPIAPAPRLRPPGAVLLEARDLRKRFGGVTAVDGVSFTVASGETLGLIGPNGAGKTTTFELLGGFTRPDSGTVRFDGQDVSHLGPEARARLGLIRSFQDAALFPTMTVTESIQLALERTAPTRLSADLLGLRGGERRKEQLARELIGFMNLQRYQDKQVQELSTGTRRIAEIACLIALRPVMLLLDEPSSGIAQRETEALGALLGNLKAQLDVTLVVIEHDIPLIMGLSDRIVAMADGRVIAEGTPEVVRHDPAVVEAYLGGDPDAIERSGGAAPPAAARSNGRPVVVDDTLAGVRGLGLARQTALLAEFGDVEAIRNASVEDLTRVPGIGRSTAERVLEELR